MSSHGSDREGVEGSRGWASLLFIYITIFFVFLEVLKEDCSNPLIVSYLVWCIIWSAIAKCFDVVQLCPILCDPMDCSTPGFPILHYLLEFAQTHVHRIRDTIQPSHSPLTLSSPARNLSQHQSLFQWVSCSYQIAKILELQLQSFQ